MDMREIIAQALNKAAKAAFAEADFEPASLARALEIPPDPAMGDMAFPCFALSRQLRMGPPQIAAKMAGGISDPLIERAEVKGGYLNFFLNITFRTKLQN